MVYRIYKERVLAAFSRCSLAGDEEKIREVELTLKRIPFGQYRYPILE